MDMRNQRIARAHELRAEKLEAAREALTPRNAQPAKRRHRKREGQA